MKLTLCCSSYQLYYTRHHVKTQNITSLAVATHPSTVSAFLTRLHRNVSILVSTVAEQLWVSTPNTTSCRYLYLITDVPTNNILVQLLLLLLVFISDIVSWIAIYWYCHPTPTV